jgi:prepilin-type N-terminal cleavage/methylation domain-containing protein
LERKGFTLIELLVVIVIIGILVAIALPNFIKIKDKAKEAEIKQNLHAIQLAIERYATDMEGNYPFYLYGGESLFNVGTINYYNPSPRSSDFGWGQNIHLPFDMFWLATDTWDYTDTDWTHVRDGDVPSAFGDTVSYEGYMPKYPTNPFQVAKKATTFSLAGLNITSAAGQYGAWSCYGGKDGRKMWDLAEGSGEIPQIVEWPDSQEDVDQDLPGNFYYHPRWGDAVTNYEHNICQAYYNNGSWYKFIPSMPPLDDFAGNPTDPTDDEINSLDVAGYDLIAIGSPRTKGQDLDNPLPAYVNFGQPAPYYFRTGYLTLAQERNPYVGPDAPEGDYNGTVQDYDERPYSDSIPDFYIIHLGSGMDKKVANPTAAY